jgi:hypothetical protein
VSYKEKRERLFKPGKPVIRRLEILDGDSYSHDMGVLWAAYKAKSFQLPEGLSQEDFVQEIEQYFSKYGQVWIVDDKNKSFESGQGQVGIVLTSHVDLILEAKFGFFRWASKRNILRAAAAFLNMVTYSKKTGICMVRAGSAQRVLPDHLGNYGLLYYLGRSAENEYLYSVRGRAS